jgi:uncharacterized membrane protein YdjX (TVP38/TMEM64 family)
MGALNSAALLTLSAVLPLAGFPITLVYLLVGARFGRLLGLGIVGGITAFHLLGTHWVTRSFFRRPLLLFMDRHKHHVPKVPPGENGAIALMFMLTPAVPYFIRNYVLALSGIPLRIYFGVALPIHLLRSYVALFLGNFGSSPSRQGLIFLGVFYALQLTLLAGVAWWLRRRHQRLTITRPTTGVEDSSAGHPFRHQ